MNNQQIRIIQVIIILLIIVEISFMGIPMFEDEKCLHIDEYDLGGEFPLRIYDENCECSQLTQKENKNE